MTTDNTSLTWEDIFKTAKVTLMDGRKMTLKEALEKEIPAVVAGVYKHEKSGEINLTLKFSPNKRNSISIHPTFTSKVPFPKADAMIAYVDSKAQLYGEDPDQTKLPFDKVSSIESRKAN